MTQIPETYMHSAGRGSPLEGDWLYHRLADPLSAGWFWDNLTSPPDYMLNFLCTAFHKINMRGAKNPIVLLTSGSMAPVHSGHLDMLEAAKKKMTAAGYDVVAGYISPAHDNYVSVKNNGTAAMPAPVRINILQAAVESSDWIMADPWASIHLAGDVNFSVVIQRLEQYLHKHVDDRIKVCYVFGGDRDYFAKAFQYDGLAICVGRPGYKSELPDFSRVYQTDMTNEASSSAIRAGNYTYLSPTTRNLYREWVDTQLPTLPYLMRNDMSGDPLFMMDLVRSLEQIIEPRARIEVMHSFVQESNITKKFQGRQTLSLDPMFKGDANFATSRLFNINDYQSSSNTFVARPGSEHTTIQAQSIPAGDYVLVEDDSVTGRTIANAVAQLPQVNITEILLMTDVYSKQYYDVVDLRDFLVGAEHGGLVVSLKDKIIRVPYMWPFVNVCTRASIPAEKSINFSKKMWQANVNYYKRHSEHICQKSEYFRNFAEVVGFGPDETMLNFCEFHLRKFQ